MPLPAPNLDDRRFQDIVDETKRLIPRYCPEWTNHNLSDPGVALIELFAWMSETILFRINQVPDRLYTKFLDLVGIEPFPPSVAHTDLTFWLSAVLTTPVTVPAGTPVSTAATVAGGEDVVFSTTHDLVIAPPHLVAAKTGTRSDDQLLTDVWDDLRLTGGEVRCFSSEPIAPGDTFYLGFADSLAGSVIRLSITASIEGIGVDPRDPPIRWDAWSGEAWLPAKVMSDSTGGLNRDGQILLSMPPAMEPLTLGGSRANWLRARLIPAREGQPTYQATPRIRSLSVETLGGTVRADHAVVVGAETLGRSDGTPGQSFQVGRPPVLDLNAGDELRTITPDGVTTWTRVADFTGSGPADFHYVLDGATGTVTFGPAVRYPDGSTRQHGAVPPDGAEVSFPQYRHGGGSAGNVGSDTLTVLRTSIAFVDRVTNLAPATGGVDAETVSNAKVRGPLTIRTGQRAVTIHDFERLTLESSIEVARVRCLPPAEPIAPVRLLVVPALRSRPEEHQLDDFALSPDLVRAISDHLEPRRLLGTTVEVGTPFYQGVTVAALLQALPGRPATLVRQRAVDLLYRFVNPLTGGTSGEGWPFDTDINAAPLVEMLEAIEGVERVDEVLLFEFDLRTGRRYGVGREMIKLDRQSLFLSAHHQVVVR